MKALSLLICSFLISCGFNIGSANAAGNREAFESLAKEARGLEVTGVDTPVAKPEAPAWESVTVETPGAGEQNFWDDLYTGISKKDACEDISLPIEYGVEQGIGASSLGTVTGSVNRRFHRYSDKTLALVDEAGLKLEFGSEKTLLELSEAAGVSIVGGVRLEGSSMVIRPLGGTKACKELKQFANVLKYKTVLPFKASRFAAMQNGEVWKIPVVLWAGFSPTVSAAYSNVQVSVSFGVENRRLPPLVQNLAVSRTPAKAGEAKAGYQLKFNIYENRSPDITYTVTVHKAGAAVGTAVTGAASLFPPKNGALLFSGAITAYWAGVVDFNTLPAGNYTLDVRVTDADGNITPDEVNTDDIRENDTTAPVVID